MLLDFFFNWKNRRLADPVFRRKSEKNVLGQWFARPFAERMFRTAGGFIHSQVLLACLEMGVFEALRDGPVSLSELADRLSIEERRLAHLLGAAAALHLLARRRGNRFGLGPLGATMMDNPSVQVFIRHHAGFYRDLADPVAFFRGETESSLAEFWRYPTDTAGVDAQQAVEYSELMAQSQQMVSDQVLAAFSFERCRSLVDIGGGTGAFARAAVERWPHLAVTIADLPPVADIARTVLREAGLERRIDVVGLDAAEDSIPGSYDVASLVRIVHDHDDDKVLRILATAREALTQDGKLLLAEPIAASDAAGRLNDAYFQVYLLAMGSGRPRSYRELKRLLKTAGFGSIRRHRSPVPLISSVLTATR